MKRTILITGASSGLGEGMAREFAARGDNLALCPPLIITEDEIHEMFDRFEKGLARLTALVNEKNLRDV